ncbi:hypothetical protein BDK51DRAFT_18619, partial [Blyttiomyces helicus]
MSQQTELPALPKAVAAVKNADIKYSCSVVQAFDDLQLCFTIGPQVKHLYRYGSFRNCGFLYDEFVFCSLMKSKSESEAQRLLRERREAQYENKIVERPSREVWKV